MTTVGQKEATPAWLADLVNEKNPTASLPKWAALESLPRLTLRGRVADRDEIIALIQVFQALREEEWKAATPPTFIQGLLIDCESLARDAFVHALYNRYHEAGRPKKDRWVNHAVSLLGGELCALRIGAQVKQWAEALNRVGANRGIEMLKAIGTDAAIMQLDLLARKVRRNSVKVRAQQAVEQIAKARGLTQEQLADRIVPDCGLDEMGDRLFDFGPRQFWFVAGPGLQPRVRDADGGTRADLPAPRQSDDPAKAAEATAAWKLLKKALRETLKVQGDRLEQSMVLGRDWSIEEFDQLFLRHALMRHLARLLIWAEGTSEGIRTFRVGEDLTFSNANDAPLEGSLSGRVRIVHPIHLSESERLLWGQICSDYALLPPFDQINRSVHRINPGEEAARELKRYPEAKIHPLVLLGRLTRLGWQRGDPADGGIINEHRKYFASEDMTAVLRYSDGIPIYGPQSADLQSIHDCLFLRGWRTPKAWENFEDRLSLSEVPELAISETLRDLALLTALAA